MKVKNNELKNNLIRDEFFRYFYINVNSKTYKIDDIVVFNNDGVIFSCCHYDLLENIKKGVNFTLNNNVKLKRKASYKESDNFILSKGRDDIWDHLTCDLYINVDEFKSISNSITSEMMKNTEYVYNVFNVVTFDDLKGSIKTIKEVKNNYDKDYKDLRIALLNTIKNFDSVENMDHEKIEEFKQAIEYTKLFSKEVKPKE